MFTTIKDVVKENFDNFKSFSQRHQTLTIFLICILPSLAFLNSWLIWNTVHFLLNQKLNGNLISSPDYYINEDLGYKTHYDGKFDDNSTFKHQVLSNPQPHTNYTLQFYYNKPYIANKIEQPFDHFDANEKRTFLQHFYANSVYYKIGGPIFLYIEGESTATGYDILSESSMIVQYAKKYGAMLFLLEHRYYGRSKLLNSTKNPSDMQWLSSDQALADIVLFIRKINNIYPEGKRPKWVAFGGSYAGSLSSWLREKYPNDVFAAVGSSGPFEAMSDYYGYRQIVSKNLDLKVHNCSKVVSKAIRGIQKLTLTEEGREVLDQKFKLHHKLLTKPYTLAYFFDSIFNRMDIYSQYHILKLHERCYKLVHSEKDPIDAYIEAFIPSDFYDEFYYGDPETLDNLAWTWQICNEFGWFQSTDMTQNIFGNTVTMDYFMPICKKVNPSFTRERLERNIKETNNFYGGAQKFNASRVIQVYGTSDPWSAAGLVQSEENIRNEVVKIVIKGTNHCEDMSEADDGSYPQRIREAQHIIMGYLDRWLN